MHQIAEHLKEVDVKPTPQRMAITKFVLTEADHPTADEVFAWAQKNVSNISLASVYNTLNALVAEGLLKEYRFGHTPKLIYDSNTDEHFHFYNQGENKLIDIHPSDIQLSHSLKSQFQIEGVDILFWGETKKL